MQKVLWLLNHGPIKTGIEGNLDAVANGIAVLVVAWLLWRWFKS